MEASQIYILIGIIALAIIAMAVFFSGKNRKEKRLTPLAQYSFVFIILGILFGDNWLIGYGLMGIGILLAVIDIFKKLKKKKGFNLFYP